MITKAVVLVSLNSTRMDQLLALGGRIVVDSDVAAMDVLVFDVHEVINGVFFRASKADTEYGVVESKIEMVNDLFVRPFSDRSLVRFSELDASMAPYLGNVYSEYYRDASFRRHCKSQVFRNLQPKLRELGILKHTSRLIEVLVPFLLAEIAYYLFVFDTGVYEQTYGLEPEMGIITDIKARKYPALSGYLKHDVPHVKYG